nr:MAG TPA: hypothetical protein [Caudoviricetes sp.]
MAWSQNPAPNDLTFRAFRVINVMRKSRRNGVK